MKPIRPAYRRALAITASVAAGLIGAVALASPASAHHSEVKGVPYCDTETGEWVVTWTVASFAPRGVDTYQLVEVQVTPEGSAVDGIAVTEGAVFPHSTNSPLQGEQRLPGEATSASLGVRAKWFNGYEESTLKWAEVPLDGPCEQTPEPGEVEVSDLSTCEELTVTVVNPEDGVAVAAAITSSAGDADETDLEPDTTWSVSFPASEGLTYEVTIDGAAAATGAWQDPGDCGTVVDIPVAHLSDCDSLTIEVTNPLEDETIEATISSGDTVEVLTIAPGTAEEVTFDAEEGTVATVTIGDDSLDIAWEQPDGCEPGGDGGGLPVTGASTGIVIGAALVLLAAGAGLFLVARRRRITFTT